MHRNVVPALLVALLALPGLGCEKLLFAEVESPRACVSLAGVSFPGTLGASGLATQLSYDLGAELPVIDEPDVEYELRVLDMRITPSAGTDLSGVEHLRVLVVPPDGSALAPQEIVRYDRAAEGAVPEIDAAGDTGVDLGPYLDSGRLDLRAEYEGASLPAEDWTAAVEGCFHLRARVDYGTLLTP